MKIIFNLLIEKKKPHRDDVAFLYDVAQLLPGRGISGNIHRLDFGFALQGKC